MNRAWLLFVGFAAVGVAGWFLFAKKSADAPLELTFQFTCDTRGRLVPCGCFTGQYGGLTRLKTVLDQRTAPQAVRVDVGDALEGAEDYQLIEYKYLLQAFASMNFEALNMGHREARLPAVQLQELKRKSPVTLLSANLLDSTTGAPILDAYKIIQRDGRRIALVGVMDPRGPGDALGKGLAIEKMEITLGRLLPEIKAKADVIVLLAFTDEATLARLAREFYELDVILGGKVSQPSQRLDQENRSLILYVTNESRALGILRARFAGRTRPVALGHEIVLLSDKIPEDRSVRALAVAYREEVRGARLSIDDPARLQENMVPGVRRAAAFAGSQSCAGCHPAASKIWEHSAHARAFATLDRLKADADPSCIACHTVGFGSPSGYRREFAGKKLTDVGCESCHGPGSLHIQQRQSGGPVTFKFRPLGAGDCQKCHHGEFSRPFDWEAFWPRVRHGQETAEKKI